MNSGIYKYTNKINGKIYIGSAVNFAKRHWEHLNYPAKSAKLLQLAFDKYGKENFEYEILEYCPKHLLYKIEQGWINWYKCYERSYGYNLSRFAEGSREGCTSENALKGVNTKRNKGFNKITYPKLSESKSGKLNPMFGKKGLLNSTSKEVLVYNINNIFLNQFSSCKEASDYYRIPRRAISRVASGERPKTHNLIFKYK